MVGMVMMVGMVVMLSGCQALTAAAGAVAQYECSRLGSDVNKQMLCNDASGAVITVAQAEAQGVLGTKKITKP